MVMRVAAQPLVHDFILRYAEQYSGARNGASPLGDTPRSEANGVKPPMTLTESVVKILPSLAAEFTYEAVIQRLMEDGFDFTAKDRRTAIGRVLHKLLDLGSISEVTKGKGGNPSVFKRITES